MSESKQWQFHTSELKAKVGLEVIRGMKTVNQIGLEYGVHLAQVSLWKKKIQEQAKRLFEGVGKLRLELSGLKKSLG